MLFCPSCGNVVNVVVGGAGLVLECVTCPYMHVLKQQYCVEHEQKRKVVDDVLGGEGAWDNVDQTDADCPKCQESKRAYFFQLQIRSADEPMSTFYKCVLCGHQWREG